MGVRASDAERDRTVASLRRAYAAGRMKLDELERRIEQAYAATWRSELRALTRDLPFEMPIDRRRVVRGVDRFQRAMFRLHAWAFVSFNTVMVSMWALGGGHDHPRRRASGLAQEGVRRRLPQAAARPPAARADRLT